MRTARVRLTQTVLANSLTGTAKINAQMVHPLITSAHSRVEVQRAACCGGGAIPEAIDAGRRSKVLASNTNVPSRARVSGTCGALRALRGTDE
jgi:hypothetical protein